MSRQEILSAAIEFIDEFGIDKLTLRKLGAYLGKDPTAFYRHYRGKDELIAAIADRLLESVVQEFTPTGCWRSTLHELMARVREVYMTHAKFSRELSLSPDPLTGNAKVHEQVLRALSESGLPDTEVAHFAVLISRWVIAVNTYDAAMFPTGEADAAQEASRRGFSALPVEEFPLASRYGRELFPAPDDSFFDGLDLILDAVAARTQAAL